ncbi:MAG: cytochrome C oxidase subunit III [Bacteroidota bacterium]
MEYFDGGKESSYMDKVGRPQTTMEKIEKLHPYQLILYLALLGSAIIFLFLLIAHFATRPEDVTIENFKLPKQFVVSTIIIILSSYVMSTVSKLFREENLITLRNNLGIGLILAISFAISQYVGWLSMVDQGILFEGRTGGVYLYILSGLHFIHMLGGLIFLLLIFIEIVKMSKDPIKSLVGTTNPYHKLKMNLLVTYWHYLDATWVLVFLYFLFSY